jgi:hypothetical protein
MSGLCSTNGQKLLMLRLMKGPAVLFQLLLLLLLLLLQQKLPSSSSHSK